jgi:hypothetical protein
MDASIEIPLLEKQAKVWKARAQAKQKWLELALAEPPKNSQDAARRKRWITRALRAVKRGQAEIRYHAALSDAYIEHFSVLEMTLMGAVERDARTGGDGGGTSERRD